MAAYAATVTPTFPTVQKLAQGGMGLFGGSVAISNYNSTLAEVTGITLKFKATPDVICDGVSTNGYLVRWVKASKAFKCFYPSKAIAAHAHDLLVKGSAPAGIDEPIGVEGTDTLAKNAATDRTIAGAASDTKGGVISGGAVSAQAGTEVANDVDVGSVNFLAFGRV